MSKVYTWPGWECVRQIGVGSFGRVYEIQREEYGSVYKAALKVITIPQNPSDVQDAYSEGMDEKSAAKYFHSFVQSITDEFALMSTLKGHSNIVSYEDHMVIEHEDGIGWDILIRMELLTPLKVWQQEHPMTESEVIKLGCDICRALQLCKKKNIIHRDIKPENIFVNEYGDYKLGDFGIARTAEKTMSNLSKKGTYTYMAPEVYLGKPYGASADIYSLGTVLYRYLNENRTPFVPLGEIRYEDREEAFNKRVGGCAVPPPSHGSAQLKDAVLKALAFEPKDRYQTAEEFYRALERCDMQERTVQMHEQLEKTVLLDYGTGQQPVMQQPVMQPQMMQQPPQKKESGNKKLIAICVLLFLILIAVVVGGIVLVQSVGKDSDKSDSKKSEKAEALSEQETDEGSAQSQDEEAVENIDKEKSLEVKEEESGQESLQTELVWVEKITYDYFEGYVHKYEYNEYGEETKENIYTLDDELVMWEESKYDSNGHKTLSQWYFADGTEGMRTEYVRGENTKKATEYDINGNVSAIYDTTYNDDHDIIEKILYNPDGSIEWIKKYSYDGDGNRISDKRYYGDGTMYKWYEMEYDTQGYEISRVAYEADGSINRRYKVNYDRYNNPIELVKYTEDQKPLDTYAPWDSVENMEYEDCHIGYEYDSEGNAMSRTMYDVGGAALMYEEFECIVAKKYDDREEE